ncbi:trigger factor [Alicyclobacillus hesperidum URH17-3-68]|uniref:Trigger factor n=1 Tax=Alicyclobacillus hesperidum TaxID=89784 RepID=A0A1H2TA35_9BACL|nr:trigger factor [Alicyclobacillus hesperidum]EJY55983.1 trigger factor [Alicyclobacillus hesperidum URH17-3-68]GLG00903.1 trigger factor [Alicyclobacillus hesperidum subsp. aegles]GLV13819.1 trigger factor [Alicyclobacillus hesperidum]SDW40698.1 trigger factor [Alicyclobacillus hesperidum]
MTAKWEKTEANVGVLEVEVASERFAKALDEAFKRVVKRVNVPGFRKGKVPRKLFEARFGVESLYQDAVDILLPQAYQEAVVETGIEPVDQPAVDVVQVETGKPFIFKATVTVKPEVQLGEYKGLEVEDKSFDVTDETVEEELQSILRSHAQIEVIEDGAVENGDTVSIDFKGTIDGEEFEGGEAENFQLEIGSNALIKGFEEQLIGMKPGEERDIEVTFPDDYHVKSLREKLAKFHVLLHDIKRRVLRELNDEFVQEISEFQTVDEFKADLRKSLEERAKVQHDRYIEDEVVKKATANATIELPAVMVEHEIEHQLGHFAQQLQMQQIPFDAYLEFTGLTLDELKDQYREAAEQSVRIGLVLEAIANAENVEVTSEDIEAELQKIADNTQLELERVRQLMNMRDPGLASFQGELKTRKTIQLLVDHCKVV